MTDEERARLEEIRENWNPAHYAKEGYTEIVWLLDLVERQEAEIARLRPALDVVVPWTQEPFDSHMSGKLAQP